MIVALSLPFFSRLFLPVQAAAYRMMSLLRGPNGLPWLIVSQHPVTAHCLLDQPFLGHETSFMDVPRLSTIQALLLLLKARESLPKKGYYYRSWQTVKTIVSMAKDLEIHEHYSSHAEGKLCGLSPVECLVHTRIWQALLVVEVMIGAPQGKSLFVLSNGHKSLPKKEEFGSEKAFQADENRSLGLRS